LICQKRSDILQAEVKVPSCPPSLLLSSLELSDAHVYEPEIRALLGTASHFCEVVVLPALPPHTVNYDPFIKSQLASSN